MRDGYSIKRIKDICEKGSSNVAQKDLKGHEGAYPIFGASGFIKKVDFYHQEKEYVGIVKDGSGIGRVDFYPPKSSLIGTLQYIIPKAEYDIRYVGYCLQSLDLSSYRQGAAIPHIYFRDYGEREVLVAESIPEQQRIVNILDQEFSKIDAIRVNTEKSLKAANDLFQTAILQQLQNGANIRQIQLKDITEICLGLTHTPKYVDDGVPFVSVKDISGGSLDLSSTKRISVSEFNSFPYGAKPMKGDVLFCRVGTIGKPMVLEEDTPFGIFVSVGFFRPYKDKVLNHYLKYWMMSPLFEKQVEENVVGSTLKNLNTGWLKHFIVPLPSLKEQQIIVERLDIFYKSYLDLQENYKKTLALCDNLKQALLRKAFNGEL